MEKRRLFAIAIDGCVSAQEVIDKITAVMEEPDNMVSHIKLNDALHKKDKERILVFILENYPYLNIFFDLKLPDTNGTDKNILSNYVEYMRAGDIVTIISTASLRAFNEVRGLLPVGVKIALVSVLTDTPILECQSRRGMIPGMSILNDAINLLKLGVKPFDAIVCSHAELKFLKRNLPSDIQFVVPGVRDSWMEVGQQSADRVSGVKEVIDDGADYPVLGAQFLVGNPKLNISPAESRTLSVKRALSSSRINLIPGDPLQTLINLKGHYKSLKNEDDSFKGPLVTYAGTYPSPTGEKHYVGDTYFNLAMVESHPQILSYFAELMAEKIIAFEKETGIKVDHLVGVPTGGNKIAQEVGRILNIPGICLEKKVLAIETATEKEKFDLVFRRNAGVIQPMDNVIVFEDLCNNFTTTEKATGAIKGKVVAVACIVNRSKDHIETWQDLPIIAGISFPSPQFEQEDPVVSELIAKKSLITDPKKYWEILKEAMVKKI